MTVEAVTVVGSKRLSRKLIFGPPGA